MHQLYTPIVHWNYLKPSLRGISHNITFGLSIKHRVNWGMNPSEVFMVDPKLVASPWMKYPLDALPLNGVILAVRPWSIAMSAHCFNGSGTVVDLNFN